jgi:hypothetical protein
MFSLQKRFPFLTASSANAIDPELAYTLAELMDRVGHELYGDKYFETMQAEITAKRDPNYRAAVDTKKLTEAWELLKRKTWLSLQNVNAAKKITTIEPLQNLPQLEELVIVGNLVNDLGPIAALTLLREFQAHQNKISDLGPLQNCRELCVLTLADNPVSDFSPLSKLSRLNELSISTDQLSAFQRCPSLSVLEHLRVTGDGVARSLRDFPEMPRLRTLDVENLQSLDGAERFPELINLEVKGTFDSIAPVTSLRYLTKARFDTSQPLDATPLATLYALRELSFHSPSLAGIPSLGRLPVLHEIGCWEGAENSPGLQELKKTLSTWDTEFLAPRARYEPCATLEIVTQAEFDHYDQHPYGIGPADSDRAMLSSERGWILGRIREALVIDLEEDTDFVLPWSGHDRRSDTLVLYTLKAYESFREIVRRVQTILGEAKNDWIIYFQSCLWEGPDEPTPEVKDFIVWLYPQKIQATSEQATIIETLL